MSEKLIKRISTVDGECQIDYESLANLPDLSAVGVQSDWSETNEESKSYIKNRTHYVDKNGNVHRLDAKFMPNGVITNITINKTSEGYEVNLISNNGTRTLDLKNGAVPSIGDNGNWFIDGIDSGISASGLQANADWEQEDPDAPDYIKNKPYIGRDYIGLIDVVNGQEYCLQMVNGTLMSRLAVQEIYVDKLPDKMEYMQGQKFDPTGMTVYGVLTDGTVVELENYTVPTEVFTLVGPNQPIEITYKEFGRTYTAEPLFVNVAEFDPAVVLIDFQYTARADGTYLLTGWNQTKNGEPSTELIIPDNTLIVL